MRLANRPQPEATTTTDLTSRELEVLQLIATQASDKEIAAQLNLSLHTVKTHVRNILGKAARGESAARGDVGGAGGTLKT